MIDLKHVACPLCGSNKAHRSYTLDRSELIRLWDAINVDVQKLISQDVMLLKCQKCDLGFYYPPTPGDDEFYSELAAFSWYYTHSGKTEFLIAAALLSSGMRVIDVGCGIGEFSENIPPDVSYLGVDLSSRSVEIAQKLGRNVKQLDISQALERAGTGYDLVTCFQVLEHLVTIDDFLEGLKALLAPQGLMVIAVPNNDGFLSGAINNRFNMPPHHELLWNRRSLEFMADKFGLEVVHFENECLQGVHLKWYTAIWFRSTVAKVLGIPLRPICFSLFERVLGKIGAGFAYFCSGFVNAGSVQGHSSVIVLRKRSNAI